LFPSGGNAIDDVCTHRRLKIALAIFEDILCICTGRHIIGASKKIVNILAIVRIFDGVVACFEAEDTGTDEEIPTVDLSNCTIGGR